MGRIARLLSFVRATRNDAKVNDVKVDPGGGANVTAQHFADAGDDSFPLTSDYVALSPDRGSGRQTAIGYLDPINKPKASAGDKRIYARDADSGETIVELWLKSDGTATILNDRASFTVKLDGSISGSNDSGSFQLSAGGDFLVNGVTIDINGNITTPATVAAQTLAATTSLAVAGKEMSGHRHPQGNDSDGNAEQDTGPPL